MLKKKLMFRGRELTLPDERYRSIIQADRLLKDLLDSSKTPRVPREIRDRARGVLRHWPDLYYIDQLAAHSPEIITPRMEQLHRMVAAYNPEVTQPQEPDK